jgi:hypothetical protein
VGQIRTDAPKGTRFQVLRDNHSATTPPMCFLTLCRGATTYTWRYKSLNASVCGVKAVWKVESEDVVQDGCVQCQLERCMGGATRETEGVGPVLMGYEMLCMSGL